jgi:hypothetical protein
MGDGIMALFGAPLAHEDHAVRACYAALAMQQAISAYAAELRREHGVEVQIRVGLNSGEVVVRAIGSDLRMDYGRASTASSSRSQKVICNSWNRSCAAPSAAPAASSSRLREASRPRPRWQCP